MILQELVVAPRRPQRRRGNGLPFLVRPAQQVLHVGVRAVEVLGQLVAPEFATHPPGEPRQLLRSCVNSKWRFAALGQRSWDHSVPFLDHSVALLEENPNLLLSEAL